MRRVLFVDHVDRILGGGEINLIELLAVVRRREAWDVCCACVPGSRLGAAVSALNVPVREHGFVDSLNAFRVVGRRFSPLRAWRGWQALRHARTRLGSILDEFRPHAVVSCTNKDHFCAGPAAAGRSMASLWWVNDLMTPEFFPAAPRRAFFWHARRHATRLVPVSEACRAALLAGGARPEQAVTIHNGIPLDRYAPGPRGAWRQAHGIPPAAGLVGIVGRFTPWKGQDLFLQLAAARREEAPDEHYVLIGQAFNEDQVFEQRLRAFAKEQAMEARVHFVPFQERIAEALNELDVLVHASTRPEPFGRVLIEAMAVGVPVIAARAGGVPEIITDGVDGLLAEPGQVGSYAGAMRALRRDPGLSSRLVREARRTVERRFTLEHAIGGWERLLEEAC
jgi:glycosyltransferase involved in cell wall biosynthesis